jgi:small subunit ribosomal protein S2
MRNPKMEKYIFIKRADGTAIIDLNQTMKMFEDAFNFVSGITEKGKKILFVGTKRQVKEIVIEEAERSGMHFVAHRWQGGMLTNWSTVSQSIDKLKKLEALAADEYVGRPKREMVKLEKLKEKKYDVLNGLRDMNELPGAVFIVDPTHDKIAVQEARRLKIPVIALTDTNADPDLIDLIIPANDDAIKAVRLFVSKIADACIAGAAKRQMKLTGTASEDAPTVVGEEAAMFDAQAPESKEPPAEVVKVHNKTERLAALAAPIEKKQPKSKDSQNP